MRANIFVLTAVATEVLVAPNHSSDCLNTATANTVANNFKSLITSYSNTSAKAYLTSTFTDYSDSVNSLINSGCPNGPISLGSAIFTSLAAFEAGQGGQPSIPFGILKVWYNCNTVTMLWRSSAPGFVVPELQATAIVVMEVVCAGRGQYKIDTVYSEFNNGAWLYDLGVFKPSCGLEKEMGKRKAIVATPRMF